MAFTSRRRISTPREMRPKLPLRWCAATFNQALNVSGAANSVRITLLSPTDYQFSTTLEPTGATLICIVGCMNVMSDTAQANMNVRFAWGILCDDVDLGGPTTGGFEDPRIASELINEDWLHVESGALDSFTGAQHATGPQQNTFKVKAKRRLKDTRVSLIFSCDSATAGTDLYIIGHARLLLQVPSRRPL